MKFVVGSMLPAKEFVRESRKIALSMYDILPMTDRAERKYGVQTSCYVSIPNPISVLNSSMGQHTTACIIPQEDGPKPDTESASAITRRVLIQRWTYKCAVLTGQWKVGMQCSHVWHPGTSEVSSSKLSASRPALLHLLVWGDSSTPSPPP